MPLVLKGAHLLAAEQDNYREGMASNHAAALRGEGAASMVVIAASPGFEQALQCFRRAQVLAPQSFLVLQGLVGCYVLHAQIGMTQPQNAGSSLAQHSSFKNAVGLVSAAAGLASNKSNPRARVQLGLVLALAPEGRQKAAKVLHQALVLDPDYSEAVLALTDMYVASKQYVDALNMLLPYVRKASQQAGPGGVPPTALWSPLGSRDYFLAKIASVFVLKGDLAQALKFYKEALAVNPTCKLAIEGIQNMDKEAKGMQEEEEEE
jgi:tetratricopeptide (TPR) repeat protein